jgi:signal transduction histidine kinase
MSTDLRKELQQLRAEKRQMEALNEQKELYFIEMSHELRTPLNGIHGTAILLEMEAKDESIKWMVDIILRSSQKMINLINNLQDNSFLENNRMNVAYEWINIQDQLKELIEEYNALAKEKGLLLELCIEPSMPKYMYTDSMKLSQILTNLISNAIKFTEKGRVLLVCESAKNSEDKVVVNFHIRDTGIGIHANDLEWIFKQFTQVQSSDSRNHLGLGLGLVISSKLAKLMGGTIHPFSVKDLGSSFTLELPYDSDASCFRTQNESEA